MCASWFELKPWLCQSVFIFETCFSYDKDVCIVVTDYHNNNVLLHSCAISIDICSPVNKFYSIIIFSLLMNAVILLFSCLILMLNIYIHVLSLRHHVLYLNIIWSFI